MKDVKRHRFSHAATGQGSVGLDAPYFYEQLNKLLPQRRFCRSLLGKACIIGGHRDGQAAEEGIVQENEGVDNGDHFAAYGGTDGDKEAEQDQSGKDNDS